MLRIELTLRAAAQIERAAQWWAENRHAAPHAIQDDLARAFRVIARQPAIGTPSNSARHASVRRLYLSRVRYHLYYRVNGDVLVVLAFWHERRGKQPPI